MLDESKPIWVLRDARPYGPFPIHIAGRDHVVAKTPYDKRMWVDSERVHDSSLFSGREIFPISCVTQNKEEADAWRLRNEPRIGDLVSVVHKEWMTVSIVSKSGSLRKTSKLTPATTEGIVGACTAHQIRLFSPGVLVEQAGLLRSFGDSLGLHVSKDACVVLSRDESGQSQVEEAAKQRKHNKLKKLIPAK
jgi:hypothetical protein